MIVVPTAAQKAVAHEIALMRRKGKEKRKFVRKDMVVQETDYLAVLAEVVAAQVFGVVPDMDYLFVDAGYDFKWRGRMVEVRHSLLQNARLIVCKKWQVEYELTADYYVLVVGTQDKLDLIGYIPKSQVKEYGYLIDLGYGDTYCVNQAALKPVEDLVK